MDKLDYEHSDPFDDAKEEVMRSIRIDLRQTPHQRFNCMAIGHGVGKCVSAARLRMSGGESARLMP